jgi:hypothetical protein
MSIFIMIFYLNLMIVKLFAIVIKKEKKSG